MDVPINELSFQHSDGGSDADLLRELIRVMKAIKDRIADCDRNKVRFRVTEAWQPPRQLPGGTSIGRARQVLDPVEGALCDCFFTDYPSFPVDAPPLFFHSGRHAHGLGYAHANKLLAASLAVGSHAVDELRVESHHVDVPSGNVANAWRPELAQLHVETMGAHLQVLPRYSDPGHHDPDSLHYVRGKSYIPRGAKDLFYYSHRDDDSASWWTKCECNFFHRFQGGDPVHWNATTSPRALQPTPAHQVPGAIRKYWENRPGITDCGCR